jgi:hypothetical protein
MNSNNLIREERKSRIATGSVKYKSHCLLHMGFYLIKIHLKHSRIAIKLHY